MKINEMIEQEDEERVSEAENSSEEEDGKFDCQSIVSTLTNTDNHPGVIRTTRVVKVSKHKIELDKQFQVPLEGLVAVEVTKKTVKPYAVEEIESDKGDNAENAEEGKMDKKKAMKLERREKRKLKKELKQAFKDQNGKLVKATTAEIGAIRTGISVKKIY